MEGPESVSRSERPHRSRRVLSAVEAVMWVFGLVCLMAWGALYVDGAMGARHELQRQLDPGPNVSEWENLNG